MISGNITCTANQTQHFDAETKAACLAQGVASYPGVDAVYDWPTARAIGAGTNGELCV